MTTCLSPAVLTISQQRNLPSASSAAELVAVLPARVGGQTPRRLQQQNAAVAARSDERPTAGRGRPQIVHLSDGDDRIKDKRNRKWDKNNVINNNDGDEWCNEVVVDRGPSTWNYNGYSSWQNRSIPVEDLKHLRLIFLKDVKPTIATNWSKLEPVDKGRLSSTSTTPSLSLSSNDDDDDEDDGDDNQPDTSTSSAGTLSPAEVLTTSRYSSRAVSSSSSMAGSREPPDGSDAGSDVIDDDDYDDLAMMTPGSLHSYGSRFRPINESSSDFGLRYGLDGFPPPHPTSLTPFDDLYQPQQQGEEDLLWQRAVMNAQKSNQKFNDRSVDIYRSDQLLATKQLQKRRSVVNNKDGAVQPLSISSSSSGVPTTSRTCSNEMLNVISIDDDRLRYRYNVIGSTAASSLAGKFPPSRGSPESVSISSSRLAIAIASRRPSRPAPEEVAILADRDRLHKSLQTPAPGDIVKYGRRREPAVTADGRLRRRRQAAAERRTDVTRSAPVGGGRAGAGDDDDDEPRKSAFVEMNQVLRQAVEAFWVEERRKTLPAIRIS